MPEHTHFSPALQEPHFKLSEIREDVKKAEITCTKFLPTPINEAKFT